MVPDMDNSSILNRSDCNKLSNVGLDKFLLGYELVMWGVLIGFERITVVVLGKRFLKTTMNMSIVEV